MSLEVSYTIKNEHVNNPDEIVGTDSQTCQSGESVVCSSAQLRDEQVNSDVFVKESG